MKLIKPSVRMVLFYAFCYEQTSPLIVLLKTIWGRAFFGTVAQNLSDVVIMGEKSDVEYYADALENAGFTEEAKKMALKEFFLNNPVRNSTTAFVSNAIVSGANSAASGYRKLAEIYEDADETAKLTEGEYGGRINEDTDMLFKELENGGVKFSKEDTLFITRDKTGQIVWLENGNLSAGLNHIIEEHGSQFDGKGVSNDEIPIYIMEAVSQGNVVGYQGKKNPRTIYEFIYKGRKQRVAITIGPNGFIVGANPKTVKE